MSRRTLPIAALAFLAAAPPAGAADLLVDCTAFRSRWSAADQAARPGQPPLAFERMARPAGTERVTNAPGLAASFACLEGKMTHVELRDAGADAPATAGAPDPFAALASAALVALEGGDLAPAAADRLLAAMRAEADRGRTASSEWGAYEITLTAGPGRRPGLVIDHPEN